MHQPEDNEPNNVSFLRRLHWITFLNYWVGFPFFLTHGILSGCIFPALGLIPMSMSFVGACYSLIKLRHKDGQYQIVLGADGNQPKKNGESVLFALIDLGLIIFDLLIFIFTCLFTYAQWYGGRFQALAAYGTVTLFVDIAIHAVLLRVSVPKLWGKKHDCSLCCPNCQGRDVGPGEERYTDVVEVPREGGIAGRS